MKFPSGDELRLMSLITNHRFHIMTREPFDGWKTYIPEVTEMSDSV